MKSIGSRKVGALVAAAAIAVLTLSCNNELTKSASPVAVILSNTQNIDTIDLLAAANNDASCQTNIGTVLIQTIIKDLSNSADQRFNDVRLSRYRITYRRTDGGTQVPASFVMSMDLLITAGGQSNLGSFRVFQTEALRQAPFAALIPTNGGRDPETGRSTVNFDVTLEVFGETLAGSNVSGSTTFPLTFCYNCGGCS